MKRKRPVERGGTGGAAAAAGPLKRGQWTPEEDEVLSRFVAREGEGRWRTLPRRAGLLRCGKSCRLRWMNYLRPDIKRGPIADDEEDLILRLHRVLGNRWSLIAGRLPGRTDNEIKNYWNSHLSKKLMAQGLDPRTHRPLAPLDHSHSHAADAAAAADADKTAAPFDPPPPVQPISSVAGTRGGAGAFPAIMSPDGEGFAGLGDQFDAADAALGSGFVHDMGCAFVHDDETFSSFLDSLINDDCFVDCFAQGDGDGDDVHGQNDQGGGAS